MYSKNNEKYNDILIINGEKINGRNNGKAKEYYEKGKIKFEGEYLNNKKWNGKGYDSNGNIIYELIKGNGKVKEFLDDKVIFDGEYKNGKKMVKEKNII